MTFTALTVLGTGLQLLAGEQQKKEIRRAGRENQAAIVEDLALVNLQERQKLRIVRSRGAREIGGIKSAAVASGVEITGSVLDAIGFQEEQIALEEFNVGLEADLDERNLLREGTLRRRETRSQITSTTFGQAGNILTGASLINQNRPIRRSTEVSL